MTAILVTMTIVLAIAVLPLAYAALVHRDRSAQTTGGLDRLLERAHVAVPVVRDGDLDQLEPTGRDEGDRPSRG